MHTIDRYLTRDLLVLSGVSVFIFTFVMYVGSVIRVIDLVARGAPAAIVLKMFALNIPYLLTYTIPISVNTSVLLLFNRLSFDGEITALKANGLSMWQICSSVLLAAVGLSFVCLYLNAVTGPESRFAQRRIKVGVQSIEDPMALIEEGVWNRAFPGVILHVGRKTGNRIEDVVLYQLDARAQLHRIIRAQYGVITPAPEEEEFVIDLYTVRIDENPKSHGSKESYEYIAADHYRESIPYGRMLKQREITRKIADLTLATLIQGIWDVRLVYPENVKEDDLRRTRTRMLIETSKRVALSFSCVAFAMLAIPLGLKSRRRESSAGVLLSLSLVFVFYFFVVLAEALVDQPLLRPEIVVWIPILTAQAVGGWLIQNQN